MDLPPESVEPPPPDLDEQDLETLLGTPRRDAPATPADAPPTRRTRPPASPLPLSPGHPRCADPRSRSPRGGPPAARRPVRLAAAARVGDGRLDRRDDVGAARLAASLLSNEVIWGLLAAQGLLLASRLIAVGSSLFDPALPRPGRRDLLPIVLLLVFVIAPQAYAGYATEIAREAADEIFVEPVTAVVPTVSAAPDPSFLSTAPPGSPVPVPVAGSNRPAGHGAGDRRRLGRRSQHLPDRHDDHRVAGPGNPHGVDAVDPARHGRRPDGRRAGVPRQDQLAGRLRAASSRAVPGLRRDRVRRPDGRARDPDRRPDRLLRQGGPGWIRAGCRRPRRCRRQRRSRLLRSRLRRVRLHQGVLDHGRAPPPQRPAGARLRQGAQGLRGERLHPGRPAAGGDLGHSGLDRPRRIPERPDRPAPGPRPDGRDERPARPAARPCRPGHAGRARADLSGRGHAPAGRVGLRRPRLDPDPGRARDPCAGRAALPGRRDAALRRLRVAEAVLDRDRRQRRRRMQAGADAQTDADADADRHAQGERELVRDSRADTGEPSPSIESRTDRSAAPDRRPPLVGRPATDSATEGSPAPRRRRDVSRPAPRGAARSAGATPRGTRRGPWSSGSRGSGSGRRRPRPPRPAPGPGAARTGCRPRSRCRSG